MSNLVSPSSKAFSHSARVTYQSDLKTEGHHRTSVVALIQEEEEALEGIEASYIFYNGEMLGRTAYPEKLVMNIRSLAITSNGYDMIHNVASVFVTHN